MYSPGLSLGILNFHETATGETTCDRKQSDYDVINAHTSEIKLN